MKQILSDNLIVNVSSIKKEPKWMLDFRLNSLHEFNKTPNPCFGPKININFNDIVYYKNSEKTSQKNWDKVNDNIYNTFKNLGVVKAEEKYLGGVTNQYESEVIYHSLKKELNDKNIIFCSTDEALKKHPKLFKKHFNNLVKFNENKFTALNGALWSGGSFIYIPPYTKLDRPLQSYFRIDTESLGQFERTIIIVDHDSELSYIEGCTAKTYSKSSLHAGVVEIYVMKNAKMRYTTIQNWSTDIYNLVTKRAIVFDNGLMEWVDGNIGSYVTMKYPSCILKGNNSKGNSISIAYAKENQFLDAGAKMIHLGRNTKSNIISKSIASQGGTSNYRGLVKIAKEAVNSYSKVKCDTIILDDYSNSDTFPTNIINNDKSIIEHEATVSKFSNDKMIYLESKGLSESVAKELLIMGFIDDFKKELPMEYAVELNRLLKNI